MSASSQFEESQNIWSAQTMNAPWGLEKRLMTAVQAIQFFNPNKYVKNCEAIGKNPNSWNALSLFEFVKYLEKSKALGDRKPNFLRVAEVVNAMAREGILQNVGSYSGKVRFFHDCFLFMFPGSQNVSRVMGQLWLASALGPEFIYHAIGHGVVQITGRNDDGDVVAGTGIVLSAHKILTVKHVVNDIHIDQVQEFQDVRCVVERDSIRIHESQDIAIICVEQTLQPVNGLVLHTPRVGHSIYMLGFPQIPLVSSPALVMHSGEVTNQSVELLSGEKAFLYSATTRPGNSGGPIVSRDGYLLGIAAKDLTVERGGAVFFPHYAGIDAFTIYEALKDLGLDLSASYEMLE